jgi:3-hydroxyacyl-CoA dehydrogenase / enoyl-CoA hydratase / 3-hydroxybutyryl-CoA epimerase
MAEMWHPGETRDGILTVNINRQDKPVNALSKSVMDELRELIATIRSDSSIRGVMFQSTKPGVFIAGADITEFEDLSTEDESRQVSEFGQAVFQELEDLNVPTVALISGACLGGGLEFALACRYRIASTSDKTKLGLPEVQLGLLPGWGGTVRLPERIGFIEAMQIILTGRQLVGAQARSKGLVHDCVPDEALANVGEKILATHLEHGSASRLFRKKKKPFFRRFLENRTLVKKFALSSAQSKVMAETHGNYPAPLAIIETLRNGLKQSRKKRFALEAKTIAQLGTNPITRECIRLFFMQENSKKLPAEINATSDTKSIQQAAVLGAGVMGAGIALLFAKKGVATRLKDIKTEFVANGMKTCRDLVNKDVKRRKLTKLQATRVMDCLSPTVDYRGLKHADVVIEAVLEEMEIKKTVLRELADATSAETILATNTSSLRVTEMAEGIDHPERVVGLHFFNPPSKMMLVEIIRTEWTSDEAIAKAFAVVQRLGKTPVIVGDCAGFLVNRLLSPYMNEAGFLLGEVDDPMEIEKAAVDFGMPMGPLALSDLVGLDVAAHVADNMHEAYGDRMKPAPFWSELKRLREAGKMKPRLLGKQKKQLQPAIAGAASKLRQSGSSGPSLNREQIIERLIFPVINEAAMCLEEGVARCADDVDLAMVFGTGFAPFRGGPLNYALKAGIGHVVEALEKMSEQHAHLAPSDALKRFAEQGSFSDQPLEAMR